MELFITLPIVALVASLVLAGWAWRGRRVDDHPVCRRCGYDLLGVANECPECGAGITSPGAVRIGNRVRRTRWLGVALLMAGMSTVGLGAAVYSQVAAFDFYTLKPFGWTLRSAVQHAGQPQEPNVTELHRRLTNDTLRATQIESLVTAALDVQGDRSYAWPDDWETLLNELLGRSALSQAQIERYFDQGMTLELDVRPVIRRGRVTRLDLTNRFDRLAPRTRFHMERQAKAVTIGGAEIRSAGGFVARRDGYPQHATYTSGSATSLHLPHLDTVADGPTRLETTFVFELELVEPTAYAPVTLHRPISNAIELAAHNAIVDTFEVDEALRGAMADAWIDARVETQDGATSVWLRVERPAVALAMGVWLRQGEETWRVGSLHVEAISERRWRQVRSSRARIPAAGEVTVELRPEQEAVDHQMALGTYWGEPMSRDGVIVNAPYEPAFNLDASLATEMEQAVSLNRVTVHEPQRGRSISASLRVHGAPVPVAYRVRVRTGDRWVDAPRHMRLFADAGQNHGYTTGGVPLPDPDASTADILFVPDREWENRTAGPTPPWGFPILFEDVPLPDSTKGESSTDVIHGRALLDEPAAAGKP